MRIRVAMGEVYRELRQQKNLTLRQVSGKARVALGYLSEVERGHKEASSEIWECLAEALEVSLSSIVIEAGYRLTPIPDTVEGLLDSNEPVLVG